MLKIRGLGFVNNKGAYLQDNWNRMDFTIVLISWICYITQIQFSYVRVFRVLRPLSSVQRIKSLKEMINILFSTFLMLKDTIMILLFYFMVIGIVNQQLFQGELKYRCVELQTVSG